MNDERTIDEDEDEDKMITTDMVDHAFVSIFFTLSPRSKVLGTEVLEITRYFIPSSSTPPENRSTSDISPFDSCFPTCASRLCNYAFATGWMLDERMHSGITISSSNFGAKQKDHMDEDSNGD